MQINGKARTTITIGADDAKDAVIAKAKEALGDKAVRTVVKEIYVPKNCKILCRNKKNPEKWQVETLFAPFLNLMIKGESEMIKAAFFRS